MDDDRCLIVAKLHHRQLHLYKLLRLPALAVKCIDKIDLTHRKNFTLFAEYLLNLLLLFFRKQLRTYRELHVPRERVIGIVPQVCPGRFVIVIASAKAL